MFKVFIKTSKTSITDKLSCVINTIPKRNHSGVQCNSTSLKAISLVSNNLSHRDNVGGLFSGNRASKRKSFLLNKKPFNNTYVTIKNNV